ncbi:hypothetical protein D0809_11220 [Flavobacterium circumlabens]|uniref:Uncharacterized protein n=1 Tax=Flavobacterium circumlabens TaxID=2133765 RepID=A0A4Y7UCZ2_9FLAO|nr:hypothetical protein [Flavobacterium circumlabens]TCN58913.1 hypothetical protein EV142_103360 [Flavobacterium circumlabens]TEB44320.1 hypothetical protein D0809_11220 [Flavobacterium circumlabens]
MKKEENVGTLLGIPQEEMAILLQVTRGQWSMFLSGKRSLPTAAVLKLTEMLTIVKEAETQEPHAAALKEEEARIKKYLEEEIIINQHKQRLAADQLERCKKRYQSAQNAVKIADALIAKKQQTHTWQEELLPLIKSNAQDVLKKNSLLVQEQYTLKLLVLQQEEVVLTERLLRK